MKRYKTTIRLASRYGFSLVSALALSALPPAWVWANPSGPQVVSGQVDFKTLGTQLQITATPGAIINWNSFSIDAHELTRFIQQSASSAVLNRVVGQDPSRILGALVSNGQIFLINPNGIIFGAGARIDAAGLVAGTLNLSDQDFAAGRLRFNAEDAAGAIVNAGVINTVAGGQVYLIAPEITNAGLIHTPQGQIVLAAGHSVELMDSNTPDVKVSVSAPGGQALNLGELMARSGRIGIYAALIDQRGVMNADSATRSPSGQIILRSSGDIALRAGSVLSASGAADSNQDGGSVQIVAAGKLDMSPDATIAVDGGGLGGNGGQLELSGSQLSLLGDYHARAHHAAYQNGALFIDPDFINITADGSDALPSSGVAAASTPGTLNIHPSALATGDWSVIQLAAAKDITVRSHIATLGKTRSVILVAGRNIRIAADWGFSAQPLAADVSLTAVNRIYLDGSIYLADGYSLTLNMSSPLAPIYAVSGPANYVPLPAVPPGVDASLLAQLGSLATTTGLLSELKKDDRYASYACK